MWNIGLTVLNRMLLGTWMLVASLIVMQSGCGGGSDNKITLPDNPKPLPAPNSFSGSGRSETQSHNRNISR
jgi:hypothetical protein